MSYYHQLSKQSSPIYSVFLQWVACSDTNCGLYSFFKANLWRKGAWLLINPHTNLCKWMAFCVLTSFCPFLRNKIRENLLGLLCFLRLMWVKFLILFFFLLGNWYMFFFSFVVICPLFAYRKRHPWNFILLVLFTILLSFTVGVACAFSKGTVIIDWLITHLNSAFFVLV